MNIIAQIIINMVSFFVIEYLLPGFHFDSTMALFVAALVMGIVNAYIKPVAQIIFLPLTILTLGITAFLVNAGLLYLVSKIVPGFYISTFWMALVASLFLSLISTYLHKRE
jgi:putative membrane protein